ncbi:MAG: hypothetical protein K6F00_08455 [Lachnospiraceae bacterium]|nr:hypothetical protein [Lachnospiraceae bacterium]
MKSTVKGDLYEFHLLVGTKHRDIFVRALTYQEGIEQVEKILGNKKYKVISYEVKGKN